MKKINKRISQISWNDFECLKKYFEEQETIDIYVYEKGETLLSMEERTDHFLVILYGTIHIYGIHETGEMYSIISDQRATLLGDLEFLLGCPSPYYTQACSTVYALSLPFYEELKQDPDFLWMIAGRLAQNQLHFSMLDLHSYDLKTKVIEYMKWIRQPVEVGMLLSNLHCSRRHLQRVLAQLQMEKKIRRIKKGVYRLAGQEEAGV